MKIEQDRIFSPITITLESKTDAIAFSRIIKEALDKSVKVHMLSESINMAENLDEFYLDVFK